MGRGGDQGEGEEGGLAHYAQLGKKLKALSLQCSCIKRDRITMTLTLI